MNIVMGHWMGRWSRAPQMEIALACGVVFKVLLTVTYLLDFSQSPQPIDTVWRIKTLFGWVSAHTGERARNLWVLVDAP